MNEAEISLRVRKEMTNFLNVSIDEATPEARIQQDLGADSLDQVELVMLMEEVFGIEVPDEDAEKFETVNDVIQYVTNQLKEA